MAHKLTIKGSAILDKILASEDRFVLNVGGSRSSKTYSVLQYILIYCLKNRGKVITIARKTFPSLRLGAYREFIEILKKYKIYKSEWHNKTNNIYTLNENTIQFISIDQSIKLRGLKHDLVFIDEVNEIEKEEADQIFLRTSERIIMAQNPSNALHWSLLMKDRPDCLYIHSTYKDNPFLDKEIVKQIESYKETDEDLWQVYGLGLPAKNNELVYNTWQTFQDFELWTEIDGEKIANYEFEFWGLDFGYNHPTALVKIWLNIDKAKIWAKEVIYESYLTTSDLIRKMKDLNIQGQIFCDSAEPKTIEEIRRAGFDCGPSNKEVKAGIDCIKSHHLYIHHESRGLQEELRKYKWKMSAGQKTDEPVRLFDDALCALRYGVWTFINRTKRSQDYDFDIDWIDL